MWRIHARQEHAQAAGEAASPPTPDGQEADALTEPRETPAEFRARMRSISVNRSPERADIDRRDKILTKDLAAFKSCVEQGYMPPKVPGSHDRMMRAERAEHITGERVIPERYREMLES